MIRNAVPSHDRKHTSAERDTTRRFVWLPERTVLLRIGIFVAVVLVLEAAIGASAYGIALFFPDTVLYEDVTFHEHLMVADNALGVSALVEVVCLPLVLFAGFLVAKHAPIPPKEVPELRSSVLTRFQTDATDSIGRRKP